MKFRNDRIHEFRAFGIVFPAHTVTEVSDDLPAQQVAYLGRRLTVIEDEPPPAPAPEPDTSIFDTPPPTTKRKRRTKRRFD